ncbi:hypothetical protein BKA70DRAFT_1216329 [Coprinopsis sp. MPI-PUGE-AT-0042]|nr:hypothetical protein BKA70DRAFT_1216329 [Coprinopsis sp. MPI-PUGE-AT-0042]
MNSAANVQQIKVTNSGPADATVILDKGIASLELSPNIGPLGGSQPYDLRQVEGLNDGDTASPPRDSMAFSVRVLIPETGENAPSSIILTYVSNAGTEAIYLIGGNALAPSMTYQGTQVI